jgi:hypothetical protein
MISRPIKKFKRWPDTLKPLLSNMKENLRVEKPTCPKYFIIPNSENLYEREKLFFTNKNSLMYTKDGYDLQPWCVMTADFETRHGNEKPSNIITFQLYEIENLKIIDLQEDDGLILLEDGSTFKFVTLGIYSLSRPSVTVLAVAHDSLIWGYLKRNSGPTNKNILKENEDPSPIMNTIEEKQSETPMDEKEY